MNHQKINAIFNSLEKETQLIIQSEYYLFLRSNSSCRDIFHKNVNTPQMLYACVFTGIVETEFEKLFYDDDSITTLLKPFLALCKKIAEELKKTDAVDSLYDFNYAIKTLKMIKNEMYQSDSFNIIDNVLYGCDLYQDLIVVPKNVVTIEKNAFEEKENIVELVLPEGVVGINNNAFCNCTSLKKINLPSTLKYIGENAFFNCVKLPKIELNEGLESIENYAFDCCDMLKKIRVPSSVQHIGSAITRYAVHVEKDNENYISENGILFTKDMKVMMSYPRTRYDKTYEIPNGVEIIDEYAFENSESLREIHIPESAKYSRKCIFLGCCNLQKIYIYAAKFICKNKSEGFFGKDDNYLRDQCSVYVNIKNEDFYRAAADYKGFKAIEINRDVLHRASKDDLDIFTNMFISDLEELEQSELNGRYCPYKPFLLLSAIELIEEGIFKENRITITNALEVKYNAYWDEYLKSPSPFVRIQIEKAFLDLRNEHFWKLEGNKTAHWEEYAFHVLLNVSRRNKIKRFIQDLID